MKMYIIGVLSFLALGIAARQISIRTEKNYDKFIDRKPFALLYFNDGKPSTVDAIVRTLAISDRYEDGGLQVLSINTTMPSLKDLVQDFKVVNVPTFMLMKNGIALRNANGQIITLTGTISKAMLTNFIEQHLGRDLSREVANKQEQYEQVTYAYETSYNDYDYGPSFYWNVGWPYEYGYPYGYWAPGFEFNWYL